MSIDLREEDKLLWRSFPKRVEAILQSRRMKLQFVAIWIEKVERIAFAVIVLPLSDSGNKKPFSKTSEVFLRNSESEVVVGGTGGAFREGCFQIQADPYVSRKKMRSLVPASDRFQSHKLCVEDKCPIQIRYRESDVIQAQDHGIQATPSALAEVQL